MSPQRYSCNRDSQPGCDGRGSRPLVDPGARVLDGLPSDGWWILGKYVVFTTGYDLLTQDFREGVLSSKHGGVL